MTLRYLPVAAISLLVALGCGPTPTGTGGTGGTGATGGTGGTGGSAGGPRSTGPGDWRAGDYPPDLAAQTYLELAGIAGNQGVTRQYKVHVPPSYNPQVPMPVVFCFHGLSQNAVMFCVNGAGLHTKADAANFILVMPNGNANRWNAGGCCAGTPALDEVAFVRAIFRELGTHLNVNLDRVYATGLSNGGFMSYRLGCEAADIFAAVAPGAGGLLSNQIGWGNAASDFAVCNPSEPVSVLDLHGTADGIVPFSLQAQSLNLMAQENGCGTTTARAADPASAGDTTCVSYTGCPSGIEVTGCSVQGGGHVWFGSDSCGTGAGPIGCTFVGANSNTLKNTDEIWDFFSRHSK
ncbi:MAG TPA: PHB depolymerase family esterase [Polyangiaceae bacterium]